MKPYYSDADVEIYNCDSREFMQSMDDKSFDVTITDPPYGERTHNGARTARPDKKLVHFDSITNDDAIRIAGECLRLSRRWILMFTDIQLIGDLARYLPLVRAGVWIKPNGAPQFTGDRPGTGYETIAIFHDEGCKRWNGGGKHAVWTHNKVISDHPTGKPLPLISELVLLFSDEGETIFDPFMGAGSTLLAARNHKRKAIGIEIDEKYCELAAKKLDQQILRF